MRVTGGHRSGKTEAMLRMAESYLRAGKRVHVEGRSLTDAQVDRLAVAATAGRVMVINVSQICDSQISTPSKEQP